MPVYAEEHRKLSEVAFACVRMPHCVVFAVVLQMVVGGGGQQLVESCGNAPLCGQQVFALHGEIATQRVHRHLPGLAVHPAVVFVVQPACTQCGLPCPRPVLSEEGKLWREVVHPDAVRAVGPASMVCTALIEQSRSQMQAVFSRGEATVSIKYMPGHSWTQVRTIGSGCLGNAQEPACIARRTCLYTKDGLSATSFLGSHWESAYENSP